MAKPRVFVSSTYYDLKHIRSSLDLFVDSLGFEPILSEKGDIAYSPEAPLDESCYREAQSADIFVLLIGGRYGSEASSDSSKKPSKSFYERYESITKKEYESAVTKDFPTYILEWYKACGINSLRDMAIHLGDEAPYKVFYSEYSRATHGLSFDHQLEVDACEGEIVFNHIRTLKSLDKVYQMAFTQGISLFRTVLAQYRPGELDAFTRKYKDEWQKRIWSIPKVTDENGLFTITPATKKG